MKNVGISIVQPFVLFSLLAAFCSLAMAAEQGSPLAARISQLHSASEANRGAAFDSLIADRKALGEDLIQMVSAKAVDPVTKEFCVNLLGEYRISQAVDVLLDNLFFETTRPIKEKSLETLYPALGSLIKIGTPAPERVIVRVSGTDDERLSMFYSHLIFGIDGAELGYQRLSLAASKSGISPKSVKLKRLAEMVKQLGQ